MSLPLQKGRLGRGLASLIGEAPRADSALPAHGEQRLLPISELHPSGLNPRKDFDSAELAELAQSIRTKGLVQPIIARPDRQRGGFEIVAGERRWRAAQKAPLHTVPVIVRELSDQDVAEFAVIENVQRKDLNPIEEAAGYSELIERFRYTQEEVAELVGKSRSHLANTLRLLKLPPSVQAMLREGKITPVMRARWSGARTRRRSPSASSTSSSRCAMSRRRCRTWGPQSRLACRSSGSQVSAARRRDASRRARTPIQSPSRRTCRMRSASPSR